MSHRSWSFRHDTIIRSFVLSYWTATELFSYQHFCNYPSEISAMASVFARCFYKVRNWYRCTEWSVWLATNLAIQVESVPVKFFRIRVKERNGNDLENPHHNEQSLILSYLFIQPARICQKWSTPPVRETYDRGQKSWSNWAARHPHEQGGSGRVNQEQQADL